MNCHRVLYETAAEWTADMEPVSGEELVQEESALDTEKKAPGIVQDSDDIRVNSEMEIGEIDKLIEFYKQVNLKISNIIS
jgi:hypothetical protein